MIRLIFFITLVLLFVFEKSSSHVQHYKNIKYLKYNLYLNEVLIGYHSFKFDKNNGILVVNGEGSFNVSKLGVDLIKYQTNSEAVYKGNELLKFNSNTIQNGKKNMSQ